MDKRQVLAGVRCPRLLWWTVHEFGAPELAPNLVSRDRMAEGQTVGRTARGFLPGREYEVPFEADGVAIRVDILERRPAGVAVIEVKAAKSVDASYIDDLAVQVHVLRATGQQVVAAELLHLNPECRAPDLSNLFVRVDLTAKVERRLPVIAEAIRTARATVAGILPNPGIGEYCRRGKEDECPFFDRCWVGVPDHHVSGLYYIGKKWPDLVARGYHTIADLPEDIALPKPETHRQVRSVKAGVRIVEPGLTAELARWKRPLACLDFETVSCAIPRFPGTAAWEQVPAQFSVHHEDGRSFEWIADREPDPRPTLAVALVAACRGAETIAAYYANFEKACLVQLRAAVPALAPELAAIEARLVDALPVVRAFIYDPAFDGGFSLKKVQPALLPELRGYDELEIKEGQLASVLLKQLLRGEPETAEARARMRGHLASYCALDTRGLLLLIDRLGELGGAP